MLWSNLDWIGWLNHSGLRYNIKSRTILESGAFMKIKVHIIAPYESMQYIIKECIPLFPELSITYSVGDLGKGVDRALSEEKNGTDIIISRGGTAKLLKKTVSIPVIDMQLSGYDMIRSLTLASHFEDKTAIVGFPSITSGAQAIIDLMDLPLKVFTIESSDEVAPLMLELKNLNYKQIAGDVITFETANAYGLKGFLIQSGKETIIKSLEDAKLIYGYLQKNNKVNYILEQFALSNNRNLLIFDERNEMIYEYLTDFHTNLITEEQLSLLNAELSVQQSKIKRHFVIDNDILNITGYYQSIDGTSYKVFILKKSTFNLMDQKGITVHPQAMNEPIAATSSSIRLILNQIKALYESNEPIILQGDQGTGKQFISSYMHKECAGDGLLITIDFKYYDLEQFDQEHLSTLYNVKTIRMKNMHYIQDYELGISFIKSCMKQKIHLFIIVQDASASSLLTEMSISKIMMPSLAERQEDIQPLVQYFLADYHQHLGTTPVKISKEALHVLLEHARNVNIDDLKNIVKQSALMEKDYLLHSETIKHVLSHTTKQLDSIALTGTLREIEKNVINFVLHEENNNQSRAAERLGINRATLWRKLKD